MNATYKDRLTFLDLLAQDERDNLKKLLDQQIIVTHEFIRDRECIVQLITPVTILRFLFDRKTLELCRNLDQDLINLTNNEECEINLSPVTLVKTKNVSGIRTSHLSATLPLYILVDILEKVILFRNFVDEVWEETKELNKNRNGIWITRFDKNDNPK